jgi:hypothetical protein
MKKLSLVLGLLLGVFLLLNLTSVQLSACTGEECGCFVEREECRAACPAQGDPNYWPCWLRCTERAQCCAIFCCSGNITLRCQGVYPAAASVLFAHHATIGECRTGQASPSARATSTLLLTR